MVRKRGRYENAGRLQSIFTVNFRETDEILTILNLFRGNEAMEGHIADLYIKMQAILIDYDSLHCIEDKEEKDVLTETFLNGKNGKPKSYFIDFLSSLIDQTYSNLIESENV